MHGREVRTCDPALQSEAPGFIGQRFNVARHRVIRFVAMHVDQQALLGRDLAEQFDTQCAISHRSFEVWNAADDVHARMQGSLEFGNGVRITQRAVLWKGDQLHVDVRRDAALDFEKGLDSQQAHIADVHMGANGQQAFSHSPVAVGEGAFNQGFLCQQGFEFAPQGDALEQGTAFIDARQAIAAGGVHVEVCVDKWW